MCGITGSVTFSGQGVLKDTIVSMADQLYHRGPDDSGYYISGGVGFGFRRLSILDLENGQQPLFSKDKSIVAICNGEIYNYKALRDELRSRGYQFRTQCDVEVIIPLYQEFGIDFVKKLNGQFSIAIFDIKRKKLSLYRDHAGITPLFYTLVNNTLVFGSEIKAILQYPDVNKEVDLQGLDQVFSFPGMVSPVTMFKGIKSLKPGHLLVFDANGLESHEYWDLAFPNDSESSANEAQLIDELEELLFLSVKDRLNADVPVGYYLSGGLDSSLIASMIHKVSPDFARHSFSIGFADASHDERKYQKLLAKEFDSIRHELIFDWDSVATRLKQAVYFSESPLKETYNTCSLALSELVNKNDIKVVLTGEGSDELFAGYVGYRFDELRELGLDSAAQNPDDVFEDEERMKLWGDKHFFYEKNYYALRETKQAVYSDQLKNGFYDFNAIRDGVIDKQKIVGKHPINKRSYIDCKVRLADHLLADHGDRVAYANSIEARYPFLDVRLMEFAAKLPTKLKLKGLIEKYIVKKVAAKHIPQSIVEREKFHFVAPGSPELLANRNEWIEDMLSYDRIKRQGYFDPNVVERIKKMYLRKSFKLNLPFDTDLLVIILTFGIFLDEFSMPSYK